MQSSARRRILYPNPDRSDRPDVPAHILNLVNALEVDVIFQQGVDGDRAASTHQNGGGRFWWATDTQTLWYDDGANWNQLAGAAQVLPAGSMMQFAAAAAPAGYLLCDGSAVSRTTYANLFAVIGTTYGAGNGTSTFNLPDLRGRVPVGLNAGTFNTLGRIGGEETHLLLTTELPSHGHTLTNDSAGTPAGTINSVSAGVPAGTIANSPSHTHTISALEAGAGSLGGEVGLANIASAGSVASALTTDAGGIHTHTFNGSALAGHAHTFAGTAMGSHTHTVGNTGGGIAHNNLQPYITLNYIIKT